MKKIYGLDSLRFFAFLSIFFYHAIGLPFAYLGVDFFFVLSSFLLTLLALNELDNSVAFSRTNFFLRRVLRIFPLYYLILILVLVVLKILSQQFGFTVGFPEQEWKYWLFLCNFTKDDHIYALRFLWSIAVEEQFYLMFMMVAPLFKKHLLKIVFTIGALYFLFMLFANFYQWNTYSNTLAYFINFACGMLAAYLYKSKKQIASYKLTIILFLLLLVVFIIPLPNTIFKFFTSVIFALLILVLISISHNKTIKKVLRLSEYLGRYTYGLYVYSGFVLLFFYYYIEPYINNNIILLLLKLVSLIGVSFASYELYEKHFIKLKHYFRK